MAKGKNLKTFNIEHSTSNVQHPTSKLHFEADYLIVKERGEKTPLHNWANLRAPFEKRP
jgi:hypothetical protein